MVMLPGYRALTASTAVIVPKDGCIIHLSEHHGDGSPGAQVRIDTDELENFQKHLLAKQYKYARPGIEEPPWGGREMTVADPFGNRLTFAEVKSG